MKAGKQIILPLTGLLLCCLAFIFRFSGPAVTNQLEIRNRFEQKLHQKEIKLAKYLDELVVQSQQKSFEYLFKKVYPRYSSINIDEGLVLLIYENDSLRFWTDNHVPVENYMLRICLDQDIIKLNNTWYRIIRKHKGNRMFLGFVTLKNEFTFHNSYLEDQFEKDFDIPGDIRIKEGKPSDALAIKSVVGNYLFTLQMEDEYPKSGWPVMMALMLGAGVILLVASLWRYFRLKFHQDDAWTGLLYFSIIIVLLRLLLLRFRWPDFIFNLELFSPSVYAANNWTPSLGDLLLHALALLSVSVYVFSIRNQHFRTGGAALWFLFFLYELLLPVTGAFVVYFSGSLVKDSRIALDLNHILSLELYSYLALFCISIMLLSWYLLCRVWAQKRWQHKNNSTLYFSTLLSIGSFYFTFPLIAGEQPILLIWTLLFPVLVLITLHDRIFRFNYTRVISLIAFTSLGISYLLKLEIGLEKEQHGKVLAENLAIQRDPVAEYLFSDLKSKLSADSSLIKMLMPVPEGNGQPFLNRLNEKYFNGYWEKFDISIYVYDSLCNSVAKSSNAVYDKYSFFEELFKKNRAVPEPQFCYLPAENTARSGFLMKFDLFQRKPGHLKMVAHVFIEADSRYLSEEIGFPMLLLDKSINLQNDFSSYSYAVYRDSLLKKHFGKYPYNNSLKNFGHHKSFNTTSAFSYNGFVHFPFRPSGKTIYLVSYPDEGFLSSLTFFSYLFSFFAVSLCVLLLLLKPVQIWSFNANSLRSRIQALPVLMVLAAMILFGVITFYYLRYQFEKKNEESLTDRLRSVSREVEYKLGDEKSISYSSNDYLTYILARFSNVFLSDINLYDPNGNLLASSRPKVIEEGLISPKMNPRAFKEVVVGEQVKYINAEQIGKLNYLSAYTSFRNSSGKLMGYINLPYFSKQADLEKEISTLLAALINIYVLLFLVSVILTLYIANRITDPLLLLQRKISNITLGAPNEPIEWSRKDEIGDLITEYNKKIIELSESAERLAKSERESAWREMARQVAHEIKNPLTPLRLSAQMLQKAYEEKLPDFPDRFSRFTKMLVEQVDTLTHIADEFSNFAVMPKPRLEKIHMLLVAESSVHLFRTTTTAKLNLYADSSLNDLVMADRDQMLRVFNNLIKNAIQSLNTEEEGEISISLVNRKDVLVISVTDNGSGMTEEQQKLVFVPSFTTKSGGMGLGLSMVKTMVNAFGGNIHFLSRYGEGTTFTVELPLVT